MNAVPPILLPRVNFRPFRYPAAFEFYDKQNKAHWTPSEVEFASDIQQYHVEFSEPEKHAVRTVLKLFTKMEQVVSDYWSNVVSLWFKHPEICMMARTFSAFESIHAEGYDKLNTELGLDTEEFYLSFLEDPELKEKMAFIDRALVVTDASQLPLSLAVFSAFTEGVSLYSSFAILLNFQRSNKLKNVSNIIAWSCRDESLHSKAGCWLFRELVQEMNLSKEQTAQLHKEVRDVALVVEQMESIYIDKIFLEDSLLGLTKEDMKRFIKVRINQKLQELDIEPLFIVEAKDTVSPWFNQMVSGQEHNDFFENRSTSYVKSWNFEGIVW